MFLFFSLPYFIKTFINNLILSEMSETSSVPTLYYDIRSPPARSCLMLLETISAKSLILKEIDIFKGEQRSPHILDVRRNRIT